MVLDHPPPVHSGLHQKHQEVPDLSSHYHGDMGGASPNVVGLLSEVFPSGIQKQTHC
jgi:hypothetical protein